MGWASHYIQKLQEGERVSFRPRGNSMSGKIESGQLVTLEPADKKKRSPRRYRPTQSERSALSTFGQSDKW